MSDYLARLRALPPQKRLPQELTDGFVSVLSVTSIGIFHRWCRLLSVLSVRWLAGLSQAETMAQTNHRVAFSLERRRCKADRCCACGEAAVFAEDWFLHSPEKARWYCGECYRTEGRA